jgi:hypothetical protein
MSNDKNNNSSKQLPASIRNELEEYLQSQQKELSLSPDLKKAMKLEDSFDAVSYFKMIEIICDFDEDKPPYSIENVTPILDEYIPEVLDRLFDIDEDFVQYFYEEWLGFLQRHGMNEGKLALLIKNIGTDLMEKCLGQADFKVAYEIFSLSLKTIKKFKNHFEPETALVIQKFFCEPGAKVLGYRASELVNKSNDSIGVIQEPVLNKYYMIDSKISEVIELYSDSLDLLRSRMPATDETEKYIEDTYWKLSKPLQRAGKGKQWFDKSKEYHQEIEWDYQSGYEHYLSTLKTCRYVYSNQKFLEEVNGFVPKKLKQFLPYENGKLTLSLFLETTRLLVRQSLQQKLFAEKSAPAVIAGMIKNNDLANAGEIMRSTKRYIGVPHDQAMLVTDPANESDLLAVMYSFYNERSGNKPEYRQNTMVVFNDNSTTLVKRFFEKKTRDFEIISFDGRDDNFNDVELQNAQDVKEEALKIKEQFYTEKNIKPGISLHIRSTGVKQKYV